MFLSSNKKANTAEKDIALSQKGDKQAFGRLIEGSLTYLYRISRSIVTNEADVEDCIQETIIKAWTNLPSLKELKYFKTWIIRILINQCNETLRKQKRLVLFPDTAMFSKSYEENNENSSLREAIARLEEDLKTVIILFYFEELTCSEISYALGIPEGTVKSRLSRAKKRLSISLKDEEVYYG